MNKNNKIEKDMMAKQIDWNISTVITLIFCIAAPIIVGTLASFFTQNAMLSFNSMNKPPFAPPAMLFPIAWTILYILMGIASFLIYKSSSESRYMGIMLYVVQLAFNFIWSLIFFRMDAYIFAAIWLGILIFLIIALIINTSKYSIAAMLMLIPYAGWCCFAMYLNIGVAVLN